MDDSEHVLHLKISATLLSQPIFISIAYAKCSRQEIPSVREVNDLSVDVGGRPWVFRGDFNIFFWRSMNERGVLVTSIQR